MELIPISQITIGERQRKSINPAALADLRDSILTSQTGLLHPIVCQQLSPTEWKLIVGERRFRAVQQIYERNETFCHAGLCVAPGLIPVTPLTELLSTADCFEAELHENLYREDLQWHDRVEALARLHEMRQAANPKQTFTQTGAELSGPNKPFSSQASAAQIVRNATVIAPHLSNPVVAKARTADEALSLIYKHEEEKALAAIAKRIAKPLRSDASSPTAPIVRHANLSELLPTFEPNQFDLILADPPYGIDAGGASPRARTVHHHNYADSPQIARDVAADILREGFRVAKPRANLFLFCDIDLFPWLKVTAQNCGWVPFRRPVIWRKGTEGISPWGSQGLRITTEFILFATKGQRGLIISPTDVLDFDRVSRSERTHGAEKPQALLQRLIEISTVAGDNVLDPCCGSGATLIAAHALNRRATGIEIDVTYYNTAMANVYKATTASQDAALTAQPNGNGRSSPNDAG